MRVLPDPFVLAVLLVDAVLLLLAFDRLLAALRAGIACFKSFYSTEEMLGNKYLCNSVRQTYFLLLPVFTETLLLADVSLQNYFVTLGLLLALVFFRMLACRLMGWLGGDPGVFSAIERVGEALFVLMMVFSTSVLLVGWILPETPRWILWVALSVLAAVIAGVYVWRGTALIMQNQFSLFFWVLYLCALEFLPISVVVNILMINGN